MRPPPRPSFAQCLIAGDAVCVCVCVCVCGDTAVFLVRGSRTRKTHTPADTPTHKPTYANKLNHARTHFPFPPVLSLFLLPSLFSATLSFSLSPSLPPTLSHSPTNTRALTRAAPELGRGGRRRGIRSVGRGGGHMRSIARPHPTVPSR